MRCLLLLAFAAGKKSDQEDLLHWAISHSDPAEIKRLVQQYRAQNLTIKDVLGDELDNLVVNEHEVVSEHIAVLHAYLVAHDDPDTQAALEPSVVDALHLMQDMLNQVDLAMDLGKLGGTGPLLALALPAGVPGAVRAEALGVLTVAAQNNEPVQELLLAEAVLEPVMQSLQGGDAGGPVGLRQLSFLSSVLGQSPDAWRAATEVGLLDWLCTTGADLDGRAAKRSLTLLETVFLLQVEANVEAEVEACACRPALARHASNSADLDLAEKAFAAYLAGVDAGAIAPGEVPEHFQRTVRGCLGRQPADEYCRSLAELLPKGFELEEL